MSVPQKGSWFDALVDYSPIWALVLAWVTIAAKATKVDNPYTWVVGLTTLPALFAILYSGWIVHRSRCENNTGKEGPG